MTDSAAWWNANGFGQDEIDALKDHGPGPEERKLINRIKFRLFGRWPDSVVRERLAEDDAIRTRVRRITAENREALDILRRNGD